MGEEPSVITTLSVTGNTVVAVMFVI